MNDIEQASCKIARLVLIVALAVIAGLAGNSVYWRLEGELYFRSRSGKCVDVAEWIRTNGYERGKQ